MGLLSMFTDPTGKMSQSEINSQTISQLIDEMNRNQDQLDSLSSGMAISQYNTITLNTATQTQVQADTGFNTNTSSGVTFLAFVSRSDVAGAFYQLPYFVTTGGSPTNLSLSIYAQLGPIFPNPEIYLTFSVAAVAGYVLPATFTFYYFILNQPVGATI